MQAQYLNPITLKGGGHLECIKTDKENAQAYNTVGAASAYAFPVML